MRTEVRLRLHSSGRSWVAPVAGVADDGDTQKDDERPENHRDTVRRHGVELVRVVEIVERRIHRVPLDEATEADKACGIHEGSAAPCPATRPGGVVSHVTHVT